MIREYLYLETSGDETIKQFRFSFLMEETTSRGKLSRVQGSPAFVSVSSTVLHLGGVDLSSSAGEAEPVAKDRGAVLSEGSGRTSIEIEVSNVVVVDSTRGAESVGVPENVSLGEQDVVLHRDSDSSVRSEELRGSNASRSVDVGQTGNESQKTNVGPIDRGCGSSTVGARSYSAELDGIDESPVGGSNESRAVFHRNGSRESVLAESSTSVRLEIDRGVGIHGGTFIEDDVTIDDQTVDRECFH